MTLTAGSSPNRLTLMTRSPALTSPNEAHTIPVLLTGGHRVGQTFRADQNNLDGLWLPIDRLEASTGPTNFVFHLASPPLLPYSSWLSKLRLLLVIVLGLIVLWKLMPRRGQTNYLLICVAVIMAGLFGTHTILKSANNAGYPFPLIFQFVVVFHYWSWYVFSFDKLRTMKTAPPPAKANFNRYDQALARLRSLPNFAAFVMLLTLLSALGVLSYYKFNGPAALRFAFDYNYFLYFLVFHVTFSFHPRLRIRNPTVREGTLS